MVLLSLGPQALIVLLHADKRAGGAIPAPLQRSTTTEPLVAAPFEPADAPSFPLFLQSSN